MRLGRHRTQKRLYQVHHEIGTGRFPNAAMLARKLHCSEKSIRRELNCLRRDYSAPLRFDHQKRGYSYTAPFDLPAIAISEGELLSLFLGWQLLRPYRGTDVGEQLATLYAKLADYLPDHINVDLGDLHRTYAVSDAPTEEVEPEILAAVFQAVKEQRCIDIEYYTASRDMIGRRVLEPYGFQLVDSAMLLIAYCRSREEVLKFHPARILKLTRLEETFEKPADFDMEKYLEPGFRAMRGTGPPQTVTLRFSPVVARYIKVEYHPSQVKEKQPDGSVLLHFRVNHTLGLKRLALSFGPDCEVLAPASLREEYAADVREMMGKVIQRDATQNKELNDGK